MCNYELSGVVPGVAKPELVQSALCFSKLQLSHCEIRNPRPPFCYCSNIQTIGYKYIGWVCCCCCKSVACVRICSLERQVISKWSLGIRQWTEMWAPKANCPHSSTSTRGLCSFNASLPATILLLKHLCFNIWIFAVFQVSPELGYFNILHLKRFLDCLWTYFIIILIQSDDNDNMAFSVSGGFTCVYLSHVVPFYLKLRERTDCFYI